MCYSNDKDLLLKQCELLREIVGTEELHRKNLYEIKISKQEAEKFLISGFVYGLNIDSQHAFF